MAQTPKRPRDANQLAKAIVDLAIGDAHAEPAPSPQHSRAGAAGGRARAERLSADRREQIAKEAASRRWARTAAPSEED